MMKINDLRIGNILKDVEGDKVKVSTIQNDATIRVLDNKGKERGCFMISNFQPIPLTEEILLKCGFSFVRASYNDFDIVGYWALGFGEFDLKEFKDGSFSFEVLSKWLDVKHLHQLQNLYYSLTSQELEIDL